MNIPQLYHRGQTQQLQDLWMYPAASHIYLVSYMMQIRPSENKQEMIRTINTGYTA